MGGVLSEAMVMCASPEDHSVAEFVVSALSDCSFSHVYWLKCTNCCYGTCGNCTGASVGTWHVTHSAVVAACDDCPVQVPPSNAAVGERVVCGNFPGEPGSVSQVQKKKVWDFCKGDLMANESLQATYKGDVFTTSAGPCTVATLKNCPIA